MTTIAVVFGGPSPEHDISILTGLQAARLLAEARHDVVPLYWSRSGTWLRVPKDLEGSDFVGPDIEASTTVAFRVPDGFSERRRLKDVPLHLDAVLNCCHGGPGEDGTLTALLALVGLPVTGPNAEAAAWCMDKLASAGLVLAARLDRFGIEAIPTLPIVESLADVNFPKPWLVKPRFGGSSVGVEVGVEDMETAQALARSGVARSGAVLQPQLLGWADLNIAVRTYPRPECSVIERPLATGGAYGYSEKYLAGAGGMESARREMPANVAPDVSERIRLAALALTETVGLSGTPRIDFLYDGEDRLALCEVNGIPGSLALYLWAASGIERSQAVADLVEEAIKDGGGAPPHWSASTDRAALRAAKSVAAKLQ
jgi:D-alanine-D-alanine ligase